MDDEDFDKWVSLQRQDIEHYLERQGIKSPNVGLWPAFDVAPYFAIWAVESQKTAGKIGWWAFSGDCPTDYVSEMGECHPRAALGNLLESWRNSIPHMKVGRSPPNTRLGPEEDLSMLADLLESRVALLHRWYLDDKLWDDQ